MARRRPSPALLASAAALTVAVLLAPAVALAQDPAVAPAALGPVLDGEVPGLTATATSSFGAEEGEDMLVVVEVANDTGAPASVAVPFGTLLATEHDADQTVAVGGPVDDPTLAQVAAGGGEPELAVPPGESTHTLVVYCTEADDGAPLEPTPLEHIGSATDPLPTVLRTVAVQQPRPEVAQDAVWWVTDDATTPVPAALAPLLEGVDTDAFAADPHRVVPDRGYTPRWARAGLVEESFDGAAPLGGDRGAGSVGLGALVWLLAGTAAVVAVVVVASRSGRGRPAPLAAPARPAGWYPDPWVRGQLRWWDGRAWTGQVGGHT